MQFDQIVLVLGQRPFTLLDLMVAGGVAALIFITITLLLVWRGQAGRRRESHDAARRVEELEFRLAEMAGSLKTYAEQTQGTHTHLADTLNERLDQVSHRLGLGLSDQAERTSQSLAQLHERLAVIDTAQKNLSALSTEMVSLKDILANKQARGAYGQGRMEAIIRDGLPSAAYSLQATLSNGNRPDCLVTLPDSALKLVIDAKFPLEAFNALRQAKGEGETRAAQSRVRGDVQKHVKDIAGKYLIAGETHETAVMFVPSEAIYADLYEHFDDVIQNAHRARVIIASPNILMLLIQTMQAVFKDVAMREQAGLIKVEVSRLMEDLSRLQERVTDLQKHFGAATGDLERLTISAEKIAKRGLRIETLDLSEERSIAPPEGRPRLVERG
ncbi:MAG: DNA recombination protein RmuC [Alphaproteobacteria bacterium]|nr:DNA recombination protein RmuC [Alphaproteobacteria bacterium]